MKGKHESSFYTYTTFPYTGLLELVTISTSTKSALNLAHAVIITHNIVDCSEK